MWNGLSKDLKHCSNQSSKSNLTQKDESTIGVRVLRPQERKHVSSAPEDENQPSSLIQDPVCSFSVGDGVAAASTP